MMASPTLAETYCREPLVEVMTKHNLLLSSFRNWHDFSVVEADKDEILRALRISEQMDKACKFMPCLRDIAQETLGTPCAVEFEPLAPSGSGWLRAELLGLIDDEEGLVALVDRGGTHKFLRSAIKPLPKELADACPPAAINCQFPADTAPDIPLPDEPLGPDGKGKKASLEILFLGKVGEHGERWDVKVTSYGASTEEEDDITKAKRTHLLAKIESDGKSKLTNRKRVMSYEPCRVVTVYATCIVVESNAGRGRSSGTQVQISAQQCSLYGGSLREARLDNLFKVRDELEVSAHLNSYLNKETQEVTDQEWVGRDMRDSALVQYLRTGRYPRDEFVAFGSIRKVEKDSVEIASRLFSLTVYATEQAFNRREGKPSNEKVDLESVARPHHTCVMRVRHMRGRTEAVAVEVFPSIEDVGVLYLVREEYSVILRTTLEEPGKGERMECRYIFVPNGAIEANGLPIHDWYGRHVTFVAVIDQPDGDGSTVQRWRGIKVEIQYDLDKPDKYPRGHYKHQGVWMPKPEMVMSGASGSRRRMDDDNDEEFRAPPSLLDEWKKEGLTNPETSGPKKGGFADAASPCQYTPSEMRDVEANFVPTVYKPVLASQCLSRNTEVNRQEDAAQQSGRQPDSRVAQVNQTEARLVAEGAQVVIRHESSQSQRSQTVPINHSLQVEMKVTEALGALNEQKQSVPNPETALLLDFDSEEPQKEQWSNGEDAISRNFGDVRDLIDLGISFESREQAAKKAVDEQSSVNGTVANSDAQCSSQSAEDVKAADSRAAVVDALKVLQNAGQKDAELSKEIELLLKQMSKSGTS